MRHYSLDLLLTVPTLPHCPKEFPASLLFLAVSSQFAISSSSQLPLQQPNMVESVFP
jgi:hypothetical protein